MNLRALEIDEAVKDGDKVLSVMFTKAELAFITTSLIMMYGDVGARDLDNGAVYLRELKKIYGTDYKTIFKKMNEIGNGKPIMLLSEDILERSNQEAEERRSGSSKS